MTETVTLEALNAMPMEDFATVLGDIFEHSPWVPEGAAGARPFATLDSLHDAMVAVVLAAPHPQKLALIRAHPDLAGRLAVEGGLTEASTSEQASAGLDCCHRLAQLRHGPVERAPLEGDLSRADHDQNKRRADQKRHRTPEGLPEIDRRDHHAGNDRGQS